eukprot:UN05290
MIDLDEHKGTEGKIDRQKVMFVYTCQTGRQSISVKGQPSELSQVMARLGPKLHKTHKGD